MSSSAENKTCGICSGSVETRQGQVSFTAECSHSFHYDCISNYGNHLCPLCNSKWNNLPFAPPFPATHFPIIHPPAFPVYTSTTPSFPPPLFTRFPQPQFGPEPEPEPEPLQFCDDEDLPTITTDPASSALQKVTVKAIPERPALAASESISLFTVLVGLKAPSLSNDARCSQRAPIDIVTVLDVSGSMFGRKLDLLKQAVRFVIDNLGVSDRLSIVSFSDRAWRLSPLRRMTENGREDAKRAVDSLLARGGTNIVQGLKKGAQVLEERRHMNPVSTIIFLSDGNDTCNTSSFNFQGFQNIKSAPDYLHLLPASIFPRDGGEQQLIPVHSFGFGSDHDPITMHAISDASGGTFSFIESYEMVQDAFAGCIGGLLSVVTHDLCLTIRSASHGVEIKSIPSGRYASEISNKGSEGLINVGDLYADEEKEFLINSSISSEENEHKTSLLDIMCTYKDAVSNEIVQIECDLVEIQRPEYVSPQDMTINLEVDRQRNRLHVAESIKQAQQMAEIGNLSGAQNLLAKKRSDLMATASAQSGDGLCMWLEADMKETEKRMGSLRLYQQSGRAYALSGMSSHASQRATTKGNVVAGGAAQVNSFGFGGASYAAAPAPAAFRAYATPNMANMVHKSQQLNKKKEEAIPEKE